MAGGSQYRFCATTDACFEDAKRLRDRVLFAPLGVTAPDASEDRDPRNRHLVLLMGGVVVGYGRLTMRGRDAEISHLCVDSSLRGRGMGTEIVRHLLDRARVEGAKQAHLDARFTALGLITFRLVTIGFAALGLASLWIVALWIITFGFSGCLRQRCTL